MQNKPLRTIITCEHGGNSFPKQFSALFNDRKELLESHRGHDPGDRRTWLYLQHLILKTLRTTICMKGKAD